MNTERKNPGRDKEGVVDKAVRAIREVRVPEGPPAKVVESVLTAGNREQNQFQKRRFRMNRIMKIAAAILIVVGIGAGIVWFAEGTASIAWADVQERIRNVRTVTFKAVMHQEGVPDMKIDAMIMEPGLVRQEITIGEEHISHIMNMAEGKILILSEKDMKATRINLPGMPEQVRQQLEQADMLAGLKGLVENSESELGERKIGGRLAKGYRVEAGNQSLNIWVDAQTAEPLEMEVEMYVGEVLVTLSEFVFDKELDKSLFELEVPAGYKLAGKGPMEIGQASTEDLAEFMRFWAESRGGTFPGTLSEVEWVKDCGEPAEALESSIGEEELMKRATVWMRARLFLQTRPDTQYHYAGKGVKLGDASKAVFWYKPEGSDKYKVIYGDLSIKEVAEADLPR